jgi:fructan beta-fructosidase
MWMNDPNGMVYYEGEYHLFYQHNPHSNVWGPMHWGHAISTDLVHWEHLPIALYPDSLGTIFSGSAVIDWNNTSGLGSRENPPMVAIFTHHNQRLANEGSDRLQYQSIAYSLDKGRSWTKYPGNPVLPNPGIRDFRDPKVSWYEQEQKWIMVLAAYDRIMFYSSPDLIQWRKESEFTAERPPGEGVWECPDFFPITYGEETRWVLIVSIGGGGPHGGSGTKYYVGDFDGSRFTCADPSSPARWLDFGKDNYAGVTWSDIPGEDGRRIFLGWMSNWQYANQVPTEGWRSAMTLPRELKLDREEEGYFLRSVPVVETEMLRKDRVRLEPGQVAGRFREHTGPFVEEGYTLYEIDLTFEYDVHVSDENVLREGIEFGIILESEQNEMVVAGFNTRTHKIHMDRLENSGKSDFSEHFPVFHLAPYKVADPGEIRFHAFVDLSSIELFVDQGAVVLTGLAFPETGFETIRLYASHESVKLKKGEIFCLSRIW